MARTCETPLESLILSEGWYLTSFIPIEAILFVAGANALLGGRSRWLIALLSMCCLALLVYSGLFVAFPYYAGLTQHNSAGAVTTFHPSIGDFLVMTSRLLRHQPLILRIVAWLQVVNVAVMGSLRILKPNP